MALRAHVRCFPEPGAIKIPSNFNKVYFAPNQETSHLRSQSEMGCVCVCQRSSRWTSPLLSSPSVLSRLFVNKYPSLYTCLLWLFLHSLSKLFWTERTETRRFTFPVTKTSSRTLTPEHHEQADGENWSISLGIYNRASGSESKPAQSVGWSLCTPSHLHSDPGPPQRERNRCPLHRPCGRAPLSRPGPGHV